MTYREFIESLWAAGRREYGDLTQEEVARAIALWCQHHPIDCVDDVTTDEHVQARLAHRLFEYYDALADGQLLTARSADLGISSLFQHVARERVASDIRRHFETNRRLAELLAGVPDGCAAGAGVGMSAELKLLAAASWAVGYLGAMEVPEEVAVHLQNVINRLNRAIEESRPQS